MSKSDKDKLLFNDYHAAQEETHLVAVSHPLAGEEVEKERECFMKSAYCFLLF